MKHATQFGNNRLNPLISCSPFLHGLLQSIPASRQAIKPHLTLPLLHLRALPSSSNLKCSPNRIRFFFSFSMATDFSVAEKEQSIKLHLVKHEPLSELDADLGGWPGAYCKHLNSSCIPASADLSILSILRNGRSETRTR